MKTSRLLAVSMLFELLAGFSVRAQSASATRNGEGLPDTIEAIDRARVTTRILYVTAHPDDESAAVLTYLARGLHADVALLSLTRGEGGQNALGPEQAPQLGLIRTQELLAATRGYGVKLYFTRAKDFGFSKTPEETEKIWGDQVLDDMVRVIRTFRPNIVINNWGGVHGGHGHHQAAGLLTPRAVALAADVKAFPEQSKQGLRPWGAPPNPVTVLDLDRFSEKPVGYLLPLDEVSPLWGKSYREIGLEAFGNHHTQGITAFLNSPFFRRPIALKKEDGSPPDPSSFARPLRELLGAPDGAYCKAHAESCERLKTADLEIGEARRLALLLDWPGATEHLVAAFTAVNGIRPVDSVTSPGQLGAENDLNLKAAAENIKEALLLAAGFHFTARATSGFAVAKEPVEVTVTYSCRPGVRCPVQGPPEFPGDWEVSRGAGDDTAKGVKYEIALKENPPAPGIWQQLQPEPHAAAAVTLHVGSDEQAKLPVTVPVLYPDVGTAHARLVPLRVVPAYILVAEPTSAIEVLDAGLKPVDVLVRVHSYSRKKVAAKVGLSVPEGWRTPGLVEINFDGVGDRYAKLTAEPPQQLQAGSFTLKAFVESGGGKFSESLEPLPSMPTLLWEEPAQCVVHAFDINVPKNLKVGYITAESEPIPDSLRMLGIQVDLLDAAALNFGGLSKYDAIVVGVRAYELRGELPGANQRLLDYVSNGGTLIVQYQRDFAWDGKNYAPYPTKIDGGPGGQLPRITDETAAVNFLKPGDPLLNQPNKITAKDFAGWVQERGLYFWTDFDTTKYTPLLSMHDPGEKDLTGALVYTKLGKGTYIYTGLAFFRQLPEGVPGAYRLFVNLLSASRSQ